MRKRVFFLPDFLRGIIRSVRYVKANHSIEVECSDVVEYWQNILFRWSNTGENVKAYYDEILCFTRDGDETLIITKKGRYQLPLKLEVVIKELNPNQFLQVHEDFSVNLMAVKKAYYRYLILSIDGVSIDVPIGPSFRSMCSEIFEISRSGKKG